MTTPRLVPRAGTALTTTRTAARYLKPARRHRGPAPFWHSRAASWRLPKRSLGMTTERTSSGPGPFRPASKRGTASSQRVMVLTIADQGASSVSNFALRLIVAHYSSASALGVFAILTSTYVLSQGLVRSLSSDCLLTRSETDDALRVEVRAGRVPGRHRPLGLRWPSSSPRSAACSRTSSRCRSSSSPSRSRSWPARTSPASSGSAATTPPTPSGSTWPGWCSSWSPTWCSRRRDSRRWRGCSAPGAAPAPWSASGRSGPTSPARRRRQLLRFWDESERGVGPALRRPVHARHLVDVLRLVPAALRAPAGVHRRLQAVPARPGAHHRAAGRGAVGPHRAGDQALPGRHPQGRPLPPLWRRGLVRR